MASLPLYQIGFARALSSPGAFAYPNNSVGLKTRFKAGVLKALSVVLVPFFPTGIKLEMQQRKLIDQPQLSLTQIKAVTDFFAALANYRARDFVIRQKIANYTDAIMKNHPNAAQLSRSEVEAKCQALVDIIFKRLSQTATQPQLLFEVAASMSRGATRREEIWFPEYQAAYEAYKHGAKLPQRDRLLSPHFVGRSLVDIGCGGGDQVAYLGKNHPELTRVAGIEIQDWRTPGLSIEYHTIDFSIPGAVAPAKYDTGMLLAVLHHAGSSREEMDTFLRGARTAVNYRLIIEEDVIISSTDQRLSIPGMDKLETLASEQPFLSEYLQLDIATQRDVTIINDFIANALSVGVPKMPFPFGFRSVSDWLEVFTQNGFSPKQVNLFGFQPGNFNQACHAHFILDVN